MAETAKADERSLARELALKLLYALDLGGAAAFDTQAEDLLAREGAPERARRTALELVTGTRAALAEVDAALQEAALNWQLSRMPCVDRAVLRLGAYELMHRHEVPPRVTINEAVELAKKYSTEKSGSFVNGVLDKVFQTHCPQKV
ncbi:MAG: transcription antitermination factor NusB [Planctomycetes bacterium]|jgi:transcription antitermination factor NusB|nr:transcription antitermination factor NusB [Planctomycetota bacterium]